LGKNHHKKLIITKQKEFPETRNVGKRSKKKEGREETEEGRGKRHLQERRENDSGLRKAFLQHRDPHALCRKVEKRPEGNKGPNHFTGFEAEAR